MYTACTYYLAYRIEIIRILAENVKYGSLEVIEKVFRSVQGLIRQSNFVASLSNTTIRSAQAPSLSLFHVCLKELHAQSAALRRLIWPLATVV